MCYYSFFFKWGLLLLESPFQWLTVVYNGICSFLFFSMIAFSMIIVCTHFMKCTELGFFFFFFLKFLNVNIHFHGYNCHRAIGEPISNTDCTENGYCRDIGLTAVPCNLNPNITNMFAMISWWVMTCDIFETITAI